MKIIYGAAAVFTIIAAVFAIWWAYITATYHDQHKIIAFILTASVIIAIVLYCIIFYRLVERANVAEAPSRVDALNLKSTQRQESEPKPAPSAPDVSVKDSDPKLYIEFQDDRGFTGGESNDAYFMLVNRGGADAQIACLDYIRLKDNLITFSDIGYAIAPGSSVSIYPRIDSHGMHPSSADIFHVLWQEYEYDLTMHELVIPIVASYRDDTKNLFESGCELVFNPSEHLKVRKKGQTGAFKVVDTPRMADFALFGVAVERALGWPTGTFINAYYTNQASAYSSAIEASPVALAVQALVESRRVFEGTATDLLNELSLYADERARSHRGWPDSGWKLSCVLRRLAPNLRTSGVEVTTGERKPDHKRTRLIRIAKTPSYASSMSSIAETQPNMRTHTNDWVGSSGETPQPCSRTSAPKPCVADTLDAADAPAQTSMVRGEI